jgi:hypothetical protein
MKYVVPDFQDRAVSAPFKAELHDGEEANRAATQRDGGAAGGASGGRGVERVCAHERPERAPAASRCATSGSIVAMDSRPQNAARPLSIGRFDWVTDRAW